MTKTEIHDALGPTTSRVSIQRALRWLQARDAPIDYVLSRKRWVLRAPFTMPLEAPEDDDVVAVLLGKEIITPLVDPDIVERLARVAEELDEKRTDSASGAASSVAARVSATVTLGARAKPGVLRKLLRACGRGVVRIDYEAPWKPFGQGRRWYEFEPWALRIQDGGAYLRGWRRDISEPRTLRLAQIHAIELLPTVQRIERVPPAAEVWGDGDPAFGIDHDRPGEAVLVFAGAVARWVHTMEWHPSQADRWIVDGEVLERRLRYRSCREIARRVASVFDAVVRIEPLELRKEVARIVRGTGHVELPGVMQRVPEERVERGRGKKPSRVAKE